MTAPHPLIVEMVQRRQALGLTHSDIHAITGLARHTVRNWETGRRAPMLGALDAYLRALGLKLAVVPLSDVEDAVQDEQLPYGQLVVGEGEKWCGGCQQVRPVREFHVDRSRRDGRRSRCKHCVREYMQRRARTRGAAAEERGAA